SRSGWPLEATLRTPTSGSSAFRKPALPQAIWAVVNAIDGPPFGRLVSGDEARRPDSFRYSRPPRACPAQLRCRIRNHFPLNPALLVFKGAPPRAGLVSR